MELKRTTQKVDQLVNMKKRDKLSFDLTIQRKDDIWDRHRKSLLIHSVLDDFPIPSIFANKEENVYHVLDGKQRLTTFLDYVNGKFSLSKLVPSINGEDLAGKKFLELPEELQYKISMYPVSFEYVEGLGQDQMEEWFFRLNNGIPLRKIENTRAMLGGNVLRFVEETTRMPFFEKMVNITPGAKKRFVDQEMILQILAMIYNEGTGFSGKEIEELVRTLRNTDIQKEVKSRLESACYYLGETFKEKTKYLKKLHVPMLFKIVLDMQDSGNLVPKPEFKQWAHHFFENLPEDYSIASSSGSAKKENVQKRLAIMKQAFQAYFDIKNRNQDLVMGGETGETGQAM